MKLHKLITAAVMRYRFFLTLMAPDARKYFSGSCPDVEDDRDCLDPQLSRHLMKAGAAANV